VEYKETITATNTGSYTATITFDQSYTKCIGVLCARSSVNLYRSDAHITSLSGGGSYSILYGLSEWLQAYQVYIIRFNNVSIGDVISLNSIYNSSGADGTYLLILK
jgi:hypothetical protein